MWQINHTFRHRGRTFNQTVLLPRAMTVNREIVPLASAFAAEAYYASTLGEGFQHTEIEAQFEPGADYHG